MNFTAEDLSRLASFPEQNPNPVVELSGEGKIIYHNPAAKRMFPDIVDRGIEHPLFATVKKEINNGHKEDLNSFVCETEVGGKVFEQKLFYISANRSIRVYSSDITKQKENEKKLANLALFPEQNPNPVIEVNSDSGKVTYLNPAALKRFPDLKEKGLGHSLLEGVSINDKKDFQRELEIGEASFEQKIYFIADSHLIRVYSHDISDQKKIQKNLSRLASFPELNPSPIVEVDLAGNITYVNPACKNTFPDLLTQKLEHEVLTPLVERFEKIRSGVIDSYVCEIKIGEHYYSQRTRHLIENGVIRIFNNDITEQKKNEEIIREKNKDITDSINYSRKIQRSILPSEELIHEAITDYFILYKPKDIISGDFYWFTTLQDHFLFACADCTGHGVPGALMSMLGSNLITHIVSENAITSPAGVLHELDKRVIKTLKQDEDAENRDGMDIAFCALEINKNILHYSAANRPMAIIRNGELIEHDPSKFPIGGQYENKKFGESKIELKEGDSIYLFSDGITDQFGGPKGKKYMKKRFYELLLSVSHCPMEEQQDRIFKAFEDWKGSLEQVDDVCVIGIKIP